MVRWRAEPSGGRRAALLSLWIGLLSLVGAPCLAAEPRQLRFARHSEALVTRSLTWLRAAVPAQTIRVHEPYEGREVVFEALPFAAVLDAVYTPSWRGEEELLFTCLDGYQPTVPVRRVLEHRAWLAFGRRGDPGFTILKLESGERRRIELAPFYLVWENLEDARLRQEHDYGWPYQLVSVDLIRVRDRFPTMAPPDDASPAVRAGFDAYRIHCSRCHAIDGEGGTLGPDLGRLEPLQYRDVAWLRRWIDEPASVRPNTRMPPLNPDLPGRDQTIREVIAYLQSRRSDAGETPGGS